MQDLFTHFGPACSSPPMHRRRLSEGTAFSFPETVLTTTLFLGDLPVLCTEVGLRELFSQYGDVERVQLKKSDRDPQRAHLGFGFVKFTTRASAERALEELNGKFFLGRALRVGWADDHNRVGAGTKASDPKKNHQTAQLHVSFTTRNPNKIVSEMDLGGVFSGFGNVVDIAIKKNVLNRESGVQSGYAFVHFSLTLAGLESALSAADQVNNCTIDEITYKCKTDQALLMQYLSLKTPKPIITHDLSCNSDYRSESVSPIERSNSVENKSRPVPFTLNFSTYGNTVEPQTIYSFPSLSDDSFVSPRSSDNRRHHKQEIYYPSSSSSPVSRSSSSIRENDYNRSQELYLSLSSSMSYDEYPSYRRGGMMM